MEIPRAVPVMTLRSATLFPQALLPLHIFEPRYRRMLAEALQADRMVSIAMQRPDRAREAPCAVAGLGLIRVAVDHPDGTSHLILQGLTRVELGERVQQRPYRIHRISPLRSARPEGTATEALVARVHKLVEERIALGGLPFPFAGAAKSPKSTAAPLAGPTPISAHEILKGLRGVPDADQLADLISCALLPGAEERQAMLETVDLEPRLRRLIRFLVVEIDQLRKNPAHE
jgi:ATP-dependent Lon protease